MGSQQQVGNDFPCLREEGKRGVSFLIHIIVSNVRGRKRRP
jgi:hypothetical protein